ncbi:hypothetical protein SDC9_125101 [bioreactor metagenome]|uniref:Uncharacterized protein n=1 Tax=bioreactor metagenome TaxID=1076179 RepID=A0A645CMB6_9ZZZZ
MNKIIAGRQIGEGSVLCHESAVFRSVKGSAVGFIQLIQFPVINFGIFQVILSMVRIRFGQSFRNRRNLCLRQHRVQPYVRIDSMGMPRLRIFLLGLVIMLVGVAFILQ